MDELFKGTRMPVSAVFEDLQDGATIDEFDHNPSARVAPLWAMGSAVL